MNSRGDSQWVRGALERGMAKRGALAERLGERGAFRVMSEGGVVVDKYAEGAAMLIYLGQVSPSFDVNGAAEVVRGVLGVKAVYVKPFAKDRSKMGGEMPAEAVDPKPASGEELAEWFLIEEGGVKLEIRLWDGLSTGLFLDQRENRRWVGEWVRARGGKARVLNTFAYTCAFSVAAGVAGGETTSVDVSPRYLEWGKRNFGHNGLAREVESGKQRFARMDTFEFFSYARRKGLQYDLIILDPPSFASGNKKKGIRPWSSVSDYARLVGEASGLLAKGGVVFASTNTQELCAGGGRRFESEIIRGVGRKPRWIELPRAAVDFEGESGKFVARAFGGLS